MAKILVVEDDFNGRNLLEYLLQKRGFDVITAVDGVEGRSLAKSETPDVLITDIRMPNESGVEMINELRKDSEMRDTPIVVYTAYDSDYYDEAVEAGADKVFSKPIELFDVVCYVSKLLDQSGNQLWL
jgi:two-component system alkaline phosphatase synthesis response regulator PhoP